MAHSLRDLDSKYLDGTRIAKSEEIIQKMHDLPYTVKPVQARINLGEKGKRPAVVFEYDDKCRIVMMVGAKTQIRITEDHEAWRDLENRYVDAVSSMPLD